jgi:hypothetical protein
MHVVRVEEERRKKERERKSAWEKVRVCKEEGKKEIRRWVTTTRRVRDKACKVPRDVIRALDTGRRTVVSES